MSHFQSREFKELQAEWYNKLKKTGFEDIEDVNSPREYLKVWDSTYFQSNYVPMIFLAKQEYYRRSAIFLMDYTFFNSEEKNIWQHHSEGIPLRQIAKNLNIILSRVRTTIAKLRRIMLDES